MSKRPRGPGGDSGDITILDKMSGSGSDVPSVPSVQSPSPQCYLREQSKRMADLQHKFMSLEGTDSPKAATLALDFRRCFTAVARYLLQDVVIEIGNEGEGKPLPKHQKRRFGISEVEIYVNATGIHEDHFTHSDVAQHHCGTFYFHKKGGNYKGGSFKGLDITFGGSTTTSPHADLADTNSFTNDSQQNGHTEQKTSTSPQLAAGALIRSIYDMDTDPRGEKMIEGPSLCVDAILQAMTMASGGKTTTTSLSVAPVVGPPSDCVLFGIDGSVFLTTATSSSSTATATAATATAPSATKRVRKEGNDVPAAPIDLNLYKGYCMRLSARRDSDKKEPVGPQNWQHWQSVAKRQVHNPLNTPNIYASSVVLEMSSAEGGSSSLPSSGDGRWIVVAPRVGLVPRSLVPDMLFAGRLYRFIEPKVALNSKQRAGIVAAWCTRRFDGSSNACADVADGCVPPSPEQLRALTGATMPLIEAIVPIINLYRRAMDKSTNTLQADVEAAFASNILGQDVNKTENIAHIVAFANAKGYL